MGIRYDSVSDYLPYVKIFDEIKRTGFPDSENIEIGWIYLNRMFSFIPYGWVLIISISSLLPLLLAKRFLKKYDIVLYGTALIFLLNYYYMFDSVLRQCVSVSIFMFSIKYITKRNFTKFFIINFIGFLIHSSAIITLAFYPLIIYAEKAYLSSKAIISCIILSYIAFLSSGVLLLNQFLGEVYNMDFAVVYEGKGLYSLIIAIISALPLLYFKDKQVDFLPILYVSFFVGVGTLFVANIDTLKRVFLYLYIYQIIAISLLLKELIQKKKHLFVKVSFLSLYIAQVMFVYNYFEDSEYRTIFSDNFKNHLFYERGGRAIFSEESWFEYRDRSKFYQYKVIDE